MFRDALNFPTEGDAGAPALIVGALLTLVLAVADVVVLLSFVVVFGPAPELPSEAPDPTTIAAARQLLAAGLVVDVAVRLLLRGYYVAVHRAVTGSDTPVAPSFRGWRRPLDGVGSVVVLVVYLLPAAGFLAVGLALGRWAPAGVGGELVALGRAFGYLFGLFAVLGAVYLVPAAVTLFSHRSFRDAFDLRRVVEGAVSEDYAVAWLEGLVVRLFLQPVAFALQFLLVGVALRFYLNVAVQYLYARGVSDALGLSASSAAVSDSGAAPGQTSA